MSGKIFYRERRNVQDGDHHARFMVVAVSGADVRFTVQHFRLSELEWIAGKVDAELHLLVTEPGVKKHGLGGAKKAKQAASKKAKSKKH